jgi:hypothetical protein
MIYQVQLVYETVIYGNKIDRLQGTFVVAGESEAQALALATRLCHGRVLYSDVQGIGVCASMVSSFYEPKLTHQHDRKDRIYTDTYDGPTSEVVSAAHKRHEELHEYSGRHLSVTPRWNGTAYAVVKHYSLD